MKLENSRVADQLHPGASGEMREEWTAERGAAPAPETFNQTTKRPWNWKIRDLLTNSTRRGDMGGVLTPNSGSATRTGG